MAKIRPDEECPCGSGKKFGECHGPKVISNQLPKISRTISLHIIPEPDPGTRAVFEKTGEGTVFITGTYSDLALVCGNCSSRLMTGLNREQIMGVVLKCNQCGSYNET